MVPFVRWAGGELRVGIIKEWEENSSDKYSDLILEFESMWLILSLRKLSES